MSFDSYRDRVERAQLTRDHLLEKAFTARPFSDSLRVWARELDAVNKHITIDDDLIDDASSAYEKVAERLVEKLRWPNDAISIHPQGSASTKTLVSSPTAEKFDIDAVCRVDITRLQAYDPMKFFSDIGVALEDLEAEAKRRCWRINFPSERFYIEFTPSAPLASVPHHVMPNVMYSATSLYRDTALAVVDTPTKKWKTSNPEGFAKWVNSQADRKILMRHFIAEDALAMRADIRPVPNQEVPLSDTLRIAIRLFKRHRDVKVLRGHLQSEFKPISVIIVTLLTQCYQGLADKNATYDDPVKLLIDMAEMLPHMYDYRNGQYWIDNPTVDGENFAEKWNGDGNMRRDAFINWCGLLAADLNHIFVSRTEEEVRKRVQEVFASTGAPVGRGPSGGLAPTKPDKVVHQRPTSGLA